MIYHEDDYEHGMMCGNEGCEFVFSEGDPICESFESFIEEYPVVLAICHGCAGLAREAALAMAGAES